jgi:integrase
MNSTRLGNKASSLKAGPTMLTDRLINSLPPPEIRQEIPDGEVAGLYLIVQPSGVKSWAVRYRFDRTPRKATLGRYPTIDVATARKRAKEALNDVAAGKDPAAANHAAKAARKDGEESRAERRAKPGGETRGRRKTEAGFIKELLQRWQGRPVSEVKRAEIHDMLDAILDRGAPTQTNRFFAKLLGDWAIAHGIADRRPTLSQVSDRVLSDDEIRLVWKAFERAGSPFGCVGKLLLLTGARRDEIASGRWSEIDPASRTWTIPKERTKNGVGREIPLSEAAMRIIENLPRAEGKDGLVFETTEEIAAGGFSRAMAGINRTILEMMKQEARARAGDPSSVRAPAPWSLHHLHRTVAANLQRLGVRLEVAQAVLGASPMSRPGVADVYPTHEYSAEKRIALAIWANRLDAIVASAPAPI